MSDILQTVYNACDPDEPAGVEFYTDCNSARGTDALTREILGHLRLADDHLCYLFSGHTGCGKSSELEHLRRDLSRSDAYRARFFPVLLNASEYLDYYDADTSDLLLAIVTELAAALREEAGIELKDSYFAERFKELRGCLLSDVEVTDTELSLLGARAKVQRMKKDPAVRHAVREKLAPRMSTMLEEINTILDLARLRLRRAHPAGGGSPYQDIVLIVDNLEKVRCFAHKPEGLESHRELFLERAPQLTGIQAHVIYTVPLQLVRSQHGPQLWNLYNGPLVLPMVKVVERGSRDPYATGEQCMRSLLQKRVPRLALGEVITDEALRFLVRYSGGHARSLMIFVQNACTYLDRPPITIREARQAVQQAVRVFATSIDEGHWDKLVSLTQSVDQKIPNGDQDYLAMLENLSVLEYINGGDDGGDVFESAEPWYAVNPIVCELQRFKAALRKAEMGKEA